MSCSKWSSKPNVTEEEAETFNEAEENTSNKPEEVNQIIKTTEMERMPEKKTEL